MANVTIKLDLNDLKALFGGDEPPSVEFRTQIANAFADKYIKSLINSEAGKIRDAAVIKLVKDYLREEYAELDKFGRITKVNLDPALVGFIHAEVVTFFNSEVQERLNKLITALQDTITDEYLDNLVDSRVNKRVDALVDKAFRAGVQFQKAKSPTVIPSDEA